MEPSVQPRHAMRALNLTLSWLHHLLPYILSKVHRVSYGLLTLGQRGCGAFSEGLATSRKSRDRSCGGSWQFLSLGRSGGRHVRHVKT